MAIARMLLRGGLLTLVLTAGMATAKGNAIRASTQPIRLQVQAPVPSPAILRASPCVSQRVSACGHIVQAAGYVDRLQSHIETAP
jgi:hypothetical protein